MTASTPARDFAFAFDPSFRLPARLFGVTAGHVPHHPDRNRIACALRPVAHPYHPRQHPQRVRHRPYHYLKVAGPAHLSFSDRGLTFATNARRGVQFDFHSPIAGIEPTGRLRHPNLTVTPADWTGLIEAIGSM